MTKAVLGIIGGSGVYDLPGLTNAQSKTIESPWGKSSAPMLTGEIDGLPIVFLSGHHKDHWLSPRRAISRPARAQSPEGT
jgi:5'-methylthioadenosine phosphorylase